MLMRRTATPVEGDRLAKIDAGAQVRRFYLAMLHVHLENDTGRDVDDPGAREQ